VHDQPVAVNKHIKVGTRLEHGEHPVESREVVERAPVAGPREPVRDLGCGLHVGREGKVCRFQPFAW